MLHNYTPIFTIPLLVLALIGGLSFINEDQITMSFPICEREHYWDIKITEDNVLDVKRQTPLKFITVCGLSGSGYNWKVTGPGKSWEGNKLISNDIVIPDASIKASCQNKRQTGNKNITWALASKGVYCKFEKKELRKMQSDLSSFKISGDKT